MQQYQPGDRVTGRDVTAGGQVTGTVAEVLHPAPYSGQYGPRYRLTNTGTFYHGGKPVEPIVESVSRAPGSVVTIAAGFRQFDVVERADGMAWLWPRNPESLEDEGRWVSEDILRTVMDRDVEPYEQD